MKQLDLDVNAVVERNEDSLLRLIEGFEQYKLQLAQAYEHVQELLMRKAYGFSCPGSLALHEEELNHAIQAYFRLRDQIDWWLAQVRQVVANLAEIERQASPISAPSPECNRKSAL
jgi:virulence-associated protein VapD